MTVTRRQALVLPALACAAACSGGKAEPPATGTALATLADLPLDQLTVVGKVVLKRTSDTEVTAFSAVCTHTGCTVGASGDALVCPCHGSEYDASGAVTKGPAQQDLAPVAVTVQGGKVVAA